MPLLKVYHDDLVMKMFIKTQNKNSAQKSALRADWFKSFFAFQIIGKP